MRGAGTAVTACALGGLLWVMGGCGEDAVHVRLDAVGGDSLVLDRETESETETESEVETESETETETETESEAEAEAEVETESETDAPAPLAIQRFTTDFATITGGTAGTTGGHATLTWETTGATSIAMLADGLPVDLGACIPSGAAPCAVAGSLVVAPTERRTFTLVARGPGGTCPDACPEASVMVAVAPPAVVTLSASHPVASAHSAVAVTFTAHAADWTIGIVTTHPDGSRTLAPCIPASIATGSAACVLPTDGFGAPLDAGTIVVPDVQRIFTLGAVAVNGADDGLGDIALGDVTLQITVPVEVKTFTVTPAQVLPGGSLVLAWELLGAHSVEVTSDSQALSGLTTCALLGSDGRGFCTLHLDANAPLGPIALTLTGHQDTGTTGEAHASAIVVAGPTIDAFMVTPAPVVPGQTATLSWTAFGADHIAIVATPDVLVGAAACSALGPDGKGACVVHVAPDAAPGTVSVRLTASNVSVGPADTATLPLEVLPPPRVTALGVDDATVEAGTQVVLAWKTANADHVVVRDGSGAIAPSDLAACTLVAGPDGAGTCTLVIPAGMAPGAILLGLAAVGANGWKSDVTQTTVTVGVRPSATLSADPDALPEGGGVVTLAWSAPGAAHVAITNDEVGGAPLVDGSAQSGQVAVTITQSTTWSLVATNDFGVARATASARLAGAPMIDELTLGGTDVLAETALAQGDSAELTWSVSALDAGDVVRLERAPSPGRDASCDAVASDAWMLADGFPVTGAADGTASIGALSAVAECFRFTAEDRDTTPTQRDAVVFKVAKAPSVATFTASDDTCEPGVDVTLSWSTTFAYDAAIAVTPVGAVTSQQLADCTAPSGTCTVTIQPGTPLGDVVFTLVGTGEEGLQTGPREVSLTVGTGARISVFTASPSSASGPTSVRLAWSTTAGSALVVRRGDSEIFRSTNAATIASGELVVDGVAKTTTWTLSVENNFGAASADATTFVGPSIDQLTANGKNALDGQESVPAGPVTIAWTTTSADGSHRLEVAHVPTSGGCGASGLAYTTVYFDGDAPAPSASSALGDVLENRCVRLTVTNAQVPPQSSSATFLLREVPEVATLTTSPHTQSSGGTVIIALGIRGATTLAVTAEYRGASGNVLGTRAVCDQSSLNSGRLTDSADVDAVQCAHTLTPCSLLCVNNGVPGGTVSVHYLVSVADPEGDSASASTPVGEDVQIH